MTPAKLFKDAFNKGVRHIRHRKGFGVHSPFAYDIINQVIEERCAYYAYQTLQQIYKKDAPINMKVASLLLRLANRFRARYILETSCDGGYSILPLVLTDSRNEITSIASDGIRNTTLPRLKVLGGKQSQVSFRPTLLSLPENYRADMIVISAMPKEMDCTAFFAWLKEHSHETSILWLKGIRPKSSLCELWDCFCEDEQIEITMDLYDYGLVIRRPRFFKQHYVVSF